MLLKLTGSSCSGKSTLAFAVADRLQRVAVHDFDEVGVPERPDHHWRHRTTELWVRRALEYQDCGIDLLLTGQSPLGEVLAAPSAPLLDGIHGIDPKQSPRAAGRTWPGTAGQGGPPRIHGGAPACLTLPVNPLRNPWTRWSDG
ncbi:hypothetical protein [Amycolatopsis benzoatilytica]|uniref:hypothetical protein n=1 Tax=Amycolatopsis benzoatilytica TaxID=346045 RepID=UPI0003749091|nr:hypothetical protein [Amycolatopsis benzoatilytica]